MAKRNADSKSIKDLMGAFIKDNNLSKGFAKIKVEEAWTQVMGPGVQSYTSSVKIQNEVLVVRLTSSVLREELGYGKDKIVQMMNEVLGETLIKKVRLS